MAWSHFSYRFILLPSFAGLVCCGCGSIPLISEDADDAETAIPEASIEAETLSEATFSETFVAEQEATEADASAAAAVSDEFYQEGINLASSADALSQSAFSPDDWGLIESRWQRAAEQMEQVAAGTENHEEAQAKIDDYRNQAEAARSQITNLQTVTHVPLPATTTRAPAPAHERPRIASSAPQQVRVPIVRRLHGTPVVRVMFNGVREYEMILDTGASRTLITRRMANELGVVTTDRMVASTASDSEVVFEVGQLRSISLDSISLNNAPVSIGESVDVGLLGNDFLRGYDVTIRSSDGVVELTAI